MHIPRRIVKQYIGFEMQNDYLILCPNRLLQKDELRFSDVIKFNEK